MAVHKNGVDRVDVTVIGGGMAGMAVSIHLARVGLRVLCVESREGHSNVVGESLDWSAPDLLHALGLPMEHLISAEIATYKRHVVLQLREGCARHYVPSEWLGRPPFNVELRTLHVDRGKLNEALHEIVLGHGIKIVHDKIVNVEKEGKRVSAVWTESGTRLTSPWFVDASGSGASLFPRAFDLPAYEHGPRKVAIWTYFDVPESVEGTTIYADSATQGYMEWVWEIPIHANTISVGYVAKGETIKALRQQGQTVEDIFRAQLGRFPRFDRLMQAESAIRPCVTSFACRAYAGVCGPNWLVIGEAGAMVDPMTSNGVTAALRHAVEASALIIKFRKRRQLPRLAAAMYSRRVLDLARFFNSGIENMIYDSPVRNRIGALNAGDVYTIPAWSLNALYSRLRPRGISSTLLFGLLLNLTRTCGKLYHNFCRRQEANREVLG